MIMIKLINDSFHFRVNIMPPGRNSNCHTFSKCTTDLGSIPTEPTTVVTPVVRTSTVQLYSVTPSPSRREKVLFSLLIVDTTITYTLYSA